MALQVPEFHVPRETAALLLDRLEGLVLAEAKVQNLIASSTVSAFRTRHIDDSLQLVPLISTGGDIVDVGSGAGFPGLVLATCLRQKIALVEPRRRRAAFLERAVDSLGLGKHTTVICERVEAVRLEPPAYIMARAVAPLDKLFAAACHIAGRDTVWLLPKGRMAAREVEHAARTWQGEFELVPSITDPDAAIVVARNVRRRRA